MFQTNLDKNYCLKKYNFWENMKKAYRRGAPIRNDFWKIFLNALSVAYRRHIFEAFCFPEKNAFLKNPISNDFFKNIPIEKKGHALFKLFSLIFTKLRKNAKKL